MSYIYLHDFFDPYRCLMRNRTVEIKAEACAGAHEFEETFPAWVKPEAGRSSDVDSIRAFFVRHPLDRIACLYFSLRNTDGEEGRSAAERGQAFLEMQELASSLSLAEFVQDKNPHIRSAVDNAQARLFFDAPRNQDLPDLSFSDVRRRLAEQCDFISVYEYLPLSFQLFEMQIGEMEPGRNFLYSGTASCMDDGAMDTPTLDYLKSRNVADMQLWEASRDLFRSGLAAHQKKIIELDYLARQEAEAATRA